MTVEEWLGKNNQLGIDIWHKKYQQDNETFEEWLDRVSGGKQNVRKLIAEKKFLFGGRILSYRGMDKRGKKISLSNCYVITPPEDSIESIFECASKLARTYSYGGGCGIDISKLAPKGAKVNNAAKETTGSVSFMELYNLVTGLIGQNGRRGAMMISISCEHPDLGDFIKIKSDLGKINKANISVRITDEFMKAVENKETFTLQFTRTETGETISKKVNAFEIFKTICEMNWDYAEPGVLFWDRISSWNLLSCDDEFEYAGINPCFSGDMELLTVDGYRKFSELCDTEPYIYNIDGNIVKSKVWCSGKKETIKIKTGKGDIICTPNHKFMTIDGEECFAKNLKGKHIMPCLNANKKFKERFVKYGFIQGDGQLKRLESKTHDGIEVNIGEKDTDIYDLFSNEIFTKKSDRVIYLHGYKKDLISLGFSKNNLPNRNFPSTYSKWSKLEKASFLHGCYSANGSVIKNGRISYKTSCKKFAEELCNTLLKDFDIQGVYITTNKSKKVKFPNGEYKCKESYDINIGQYKEITKFIAEINFYQAYKREQLSQMMRNKSAYVYNVEQGENIKVYDFIEPERHWGIVNGYTVHNCAEEPLPAGGSCLLGSINLSEFVTESQEFDYYGFRNTVKEAVIALNEVLDEGLPLHPLQEQRDSVRDWRQIGLGILGLADMLIKMGVRYGSQESIDHCNLIGFTMADEAIKTSAILAKKKGTYPKYKFEEILKSEFYLYNTSDYTKDNICYGLHNSQLLTIAPTGTLSTMLGVSGGIEPIFENSYQRKTESLHGYDKYYTVYTPIVKDYMDKYEIKDESELPDYFVTAKMINYKERIDIQAIWQEHIDASISSTINVPDTFSVKEVVDLYLYAWKKGLKGVTIFRDGCKRAGILTTENIKEDHNSSDSNKVIYNYITPIARNEISDKPLPGRSYAKKTACGKMYIHINHEEVGNNIVEVFVDSAKSGGCAANARCLGSYASAALRSGMKVESVIDITQGIKCSACIGAKGKGMDIDGISCGDVIAKTIKEEYMLLNKDKKTENNIKKNGNKNTCPECGSEVAFEGGCITCKNCGWSKCE